MGFHKFVELLPELQNIVFSHLDLATQAAAKLTNKHHYLQIKIYKNDILAQMICMGIGHISVIGESILHNQKCREILKIALIAKSLRQQLEFIQCCTIEAEFKIYGFILSKIEIENIFSSLEAGNTKKSHMIAMIDFAWHGVIYRPPNNNSAAEYLYKLRKKYDPAGESPATRIILW